MAGGAGRRDGPQHRERSGTQKVEKKRRGKKEANARDWLQKERERSNERARTLSRLDSRAQPARAWQAYKWEDDTMEEERGWLSSRRSRG